MIFQKTIHSFRYPSGEKVLFIFTREDDGEERISVVDADDIVLIPIPEFETAYRMYEDEVRR